MATDTVSMSAAAAAGLSLLGVGEVQVVEMPERAAWLIMVARESADLEATFPRGKWATIQHLESQVIACARAAVACPEPR